MRCGKSEARAQNGDGGEGDGEQNNEGEEPPTDGRVKSSSKPREKWGDYPQALSAMICSVCLCGRFQVGDFDALMSEMAWEADNPLLGKGYDCQSF